MKKVAIIILTFNQKERTLRCLSRLNVDEDFPVYIVLWDNGSSDGTEEAVRASFPDVLVHLHPSNLGVASGRNAGAELAIKAFNPSHLLFLDNDMLVEPGFVGALLEPFGADTMLGQAQAKLLFMNARERLNDGGGARIDFVFWRIKPVGFGELDRGQYDTPTRCISCGGAMMVRSDVFRELRGFDPVFDPFGPEDLDFSLRLQKTGYTALYVPKAVAYHAVSHTFGEGYTEEYTYHKARHWYLFMRRHASIIQKLEFFLIGGPCLAFTVILREGRKGNLSAVRGLVRGVVDFLRVSPRVR